MELRRDRHVHIVLLAGGSGTRFWPLSRGKRPKQFLALGGKKSLLAETWKRMRGIAPPGRLWVVAPEALADDVRAELPQLRDGHLVLEPSPRDTGPAVALACATVARKDPDAVVAIFPTDHVIRKPKPFYAAVGTAVSAARDGALVCLGVTPDHPATGYGYLKCKSKPKGKGAIEVDRFVEKPNLAKAKRFLAQGNYLWNAGMFVWTVERFLAELQRTAPDIHGPVLACVDGKPRSWSKATRLSVDFAVMEKARGVRVVPLSAGWDDVGSWDAAARLREELGIHYPEAIVVDSPNAAVFGHDKMIAVVDLPDVAVVDTPDALLVVPRRSSEKVRAVVEELKRRKRKDLL